MSTPGNNQGPATDTGSLTPLKKAYLALEKAEARVAALESAQSEPIAIIGLGCRVPGGGNDPESFWRLLADGKDAIGPIPESRWDVDAHYDPDPETPGRIATRSGGFLESIDGFDAGFFGITPREADGMDPQQRLLLEVCWEALEHAGCPPDRLEGSPTGVYVGLAGSDYAYLQLETGDPRLLDTHFASGIGHSVASGRLSYLLGLKGPSLTVDTACSSSLVATHLACQALRSGDCRLALAGGVNLILAPDIFVALSRARMLSPDGRCKTFDAAADGFARAEGCGVVVLKRLSDARADGDRILAVIRGSAVNQDGASSGLTAPNGPSQVAVIREALARAGVSPREIGYLEAHGTGTQLGDPLEVSALGEVLGGSRNDVAPLWLGSVKTNLGHLEAAAGITGLIKLVLALQHGEIPPHLHFSEPSPHIPWSEIPVRVPTALTPWEPIDGKRIGGVSSFGFSGTNAHIVIGEPPADSPAEPGANPFRLFVLSATDRTALEALAGSYAAAFAALPADSLGAVCRASAVSRAQHAERACVMARSMAELVERLQALAAGHGAEGLRRARVTRREPPRVAFLFTGQGAQYPGMARTLYAEQPVFRAAFDRCAVLADALLGASLRDLVFDESDDGRLEQTRFTQPALFAVEYALAALWRSFGIVPEVVLGHSIGEYVAACLAGTLSLEDALRLVIERGRLMQQLPAGGAMAAVFADTSDVEQALASRDGRVAVAAINAPSQTVVAGVAEAVEEVCAEFEARGVRCQRLAVSHAFHSPLVEPMLDEFEAAARRCSFSSPRLRLVSNLSGRLASPAELADPGYWRRHARDAVRFADGVRTLASLGVDICLEVGPHPALLPSVEACFDAAESAPALVASLRRDREDRGQLEEAIGALYLAGVDPDWRGVWAAAPTPWIDLPPYPFQRERHWFRAAPGGRRASGRDTGHPLLGVRLHSPLVDMAQYENTLTEDTVAYLRDHRVHGRAILPATGLIELANAAARDALGSQRALRDLIIAEPLALEADQSRIVQVIVRELESDAPAFEICSADASLREPVWQRHAEGCFVPLGAARAAPDDDEITARATGIIDAQQHYRSLDERGLVFGESLKGVRKIRRGPGEALAEVEQAHTEDDGAYLLHPAVLDACLQAMAQAIDLPGAYLPFSFESVRVYRPAADGGLRSYASVQAPTGVSGMLHGEVLVYDAQGVVAELAGIALRKAATAPDAGADGRPFYTVTWEPESPQDSRWMAGPADLAAAVGPSLESLLTANGADAYLESFEVLEALSTQWIARALATLGWQPRAGERFTTAALGESLGVAPRYLRLLERYLRILAEAQILEADGEAWTVVDGLPQDDVLAANRRHVEGAGCEDARAQLLAQCGPALAEVLKGRQDPLELLFPGGSSELAERLYRDSPEARAFNQLVRDAVLALSDAMPPGRKLRILEVGGGTGGTTAWVAPALTDCSRYLFTDVGAFMVSRARERFGGHAFLDFQVFDLDRDPAEQGLGEQRFDVILASNVVHATADIGATLARLHDLLEPGGQLLMLEVAGFERWIDVSFGLTDGWWAFSDTSLRKDYPLLSRDRWLEVLATAGFEPAVLHAADPRSREALIAARVPVESMPRPGEWLVLADEGGVGEQLARRLAAPDRRVTVIPRPEAGIADDQALFDRLRPACGNAAGVVYLWALDEPQRDSAMTASDAQAGRLSPLLTLVRALASSRFAGEPPGLWMATRGAQALDAAPDIDQAPLWGLGKVVALEHPEFRPVRVDLDDEAGPDEQAAALVRLLGDTGPEKELAIRNGRILVPRLQPLPAVESRPAVRVEASATGVLDDISLVAVERRAPGPGEVEIRVVASGINFRDVMNAVAMRSDSEPLGGECAGRVVATGPGVEDFRIGDHVVAIATGCFATYAVADCRHTARIPDGIGFAAAATVPFAFMTAAHALFDCGGLRSGETVLIHAAAGGVGSAAVQLAQGVGAHIIATAGSPEKREFLRARGIEQVLDSRSLDFSDEVLRLTEGRGADLVLNSLAGEFIPASVACLAADGRFLEIGKQDIWTRERFSAERPLGRYFPIDLAVQRVEEPEASFALFEEIIGRLGRGEIRPLPLHSFPLAGAGRAFRFMAQARHTGKVVLTQQDADAAALDALDPAATYLVTGGLAGLGLLTAAHLVERGARHLVLVGRRPPSAEASAAIDEMRARGATVGVMQADVSRREALSRVFQDIQASGLSLRGVIHSAGALADGTLVQQRWERFVIPLRAKIDGAGLLDEFTRDLRLDFFVLYSSIASVLGSAGQGNHAAANAFLDALAAERSAAGLPALSVGWGAWSEIGAAAERGVDRRLAGEGIGVIEPRQGLEMLDTLLRESVVHAAVAPVRWEIFLDRNAVAGSPFFDALRRAKPAVRTRAPERGPVAAPAARVEELRNEASPERRHELLLGYVGEQVARVAGIRNGESIDPRQPLSDLGLDSLMAVELRNRLGADFDLKQKLPATLVFDYPTLEALAAYLDRELVPAPAAVPARPVEAAETAPDRSVDELSDEEIERLYSERLGRS